ncbi:hypothetical protein E2320_007453, partial [Naja naja]
TKERLI